MRKVWVALLSFGALGGCAGTQGATGTITTASATAAPVAQPAPTQPAPRPASAATKRAGTKRVCRPVADVNSLVARKVCREVPVTDQPNGGGR
jgi:hypothetical protein